MSGLELDEPSSPGLAVRREAVAIVGAVVHRHGFLDEEFDTSVRQGNLKSLSARDRRLCYALAAATLRRNGELRHHLQKFLATPLPKSSGPAFEILLVAAVQILFMRIPAHAAADIAVALAKSDGRARHFSGLINAVCRNLSAAADELLAEETEVSRNTPTWLFRKWAQRFGKERASAIVLAHSIEAPLDITVRGSAEEWAGRLGGKVYWGSTIRLQEWPEIISDMPGFAEGQWWVQDAASALPVSMLGNVQGRRILDLCAAPGGKTAQLTAAGADVTAVDRSAARLRLLEQNLARLNLAARVTQHDMMTLPADPTYDAVLLDAPCSATGTIRRHPDLIFHLSPQRIATLAESQRRMIRKAVSFLRPGGILLYSTCSLEPEEGEFHIPDLPENVGFLPFSAGEFAFEPQWVDKGGFLKTTPDQGLDGFFAMRLKKL